MSGGLIIVLLLVIVIIPMDEDVRPVVTSPAGAFDGLSFRVDFGGQVEVLSGDSGNCPTGASSGSPPATAAASD